MLAPTLTSREVARGGSTLACGSRFALANLEPQGKAGKSKRDGSLVFRSINTGANCYFFKSEILFFLIGIGRRLAYINLSSITKYTASLVYANGCKTGGSSII